MIGCLPTQALAFLAVFVYATQAIAFEWKPGLTHGGLIIDPDFDVDYPEPQIISKVVCTTV